MSYINEALKKAQKDKDSSHMPYMRSIGKSGGMVRSLDKRFICLLFIIILLGALLVYSKFGSQGEQGSGIAGMSTDSDMPSTLNNKNYNELKNIDKQPPPEENKGEKDIKNRETLYNQAASLLEDGKLGEAEEILKKILAMDPGHINSLNDLGVLSLHESRYEDAVTFFEKAVKLKPKFANPYYNLACAYSLQNEGEKGMAYLVKAIEVDENVKNWAKGDPDLNNLKSYTEFKLITN